MSVELLFPGIIDDVMFTNRARIRDRSASFLTGSNAVLTSWRSSFSSRASARLLSSCAIYCDSGWSSAQGATYRGSASVATDHDAVYKIQLALPGAHLLFQASQFLLEHLILAAKQLRTFVIMVDT